MEIKKSMRYRVNISISTKGQKTWECTCDGEGFTMAEILAESDALVKALDSRYLAQTGGTIDTTWEPNK